nr:hypothetical protein [Tanacetum cinerariifolium]
MMTRIIDPTKVRIGERECDEDEPKLLETTVGHVISLLPVAPDRSFGELEASVDKLFDEGGSGEQADHGDSASGGHGVGVQLVDVSAETVVEDGRVYAYFPFVSSSVFATPEREGRYYTKLLAGANLRTLKAPQRTFVPIMTSSTTVTPTADPATIAKERLAGSSVFGGDSSSASGSHPISGGFSNRIGSNFLVGGIRTVVDPDSNLQEFTFLTGMAARQISLSTEVRMCAEYNIKEKRMLKSMVKEKDSLLKSSYDLKFEIGRL